MYIIFRISPGGSRNRKGKGGMSLIWTPAGHGFHSVVVFMVDELSEPWLFQVPVRDKQSEPLSSKSCPKKVDYFNRRLLGHSQFPRKKLYCSI